MTSGEGCGTNGDRRASGARRRRVFTFLFAFMIGFTIIQTTVNAITILHDDQAVARWKPFAWEYTSAALTIPLIFGVFLLERFVPPPGGSQSELPGRWLKFAAVHIPASLLYCAIHVCGFTLLRKLIYLAMHQGAYDYWSPLSELPKDQITYWTSILLFWGVGRLADYRERAQVAEGGPGPVFDIRDGARLIRAPVADIVAARSAGNYVEVHLVDGRKPMLRGTLASVEATLKPHGFVRTHRSWLVNPLRVRELTAEGSGDYLVALDGGAEAPVSRRFPQALETLRSPGASA